MESARDDVYCLEISRRAVARAALRLGIKSMTEECLDVLGDVLLTYLSRLGKTLSFLAEFSGRTSAHVNALDALQAVEFCTSPAVQRVHMMNDGSENNNECFSAAAAVAAAAAASSGSSPASSSQQNSHPSGSFRNTWQGLAAFCFGPDWHQIELSNLATEVKQREASQRGGKQGPPSLSLTNDNVGDIVGGVSRLGNAKRRGWVAPYPDEIPNFPQTSWGDRDGHGNNLQQSSNDIPCTANPHNLPPKVALCLHAAVISEHDQQQQQNQQQQTNYHQRMEDTGAQLKMISDEVFTSSTSNTWGSITTDTATNSDTLTARANAAGVGTSALKRTHGQVSEGGKNDETNASDVTAGPAAVASAAVGTTATDSPPKKKVKLDLDGTKASAQPPKNANVAANGPNGPWTQATASSLKAGSGNFGDDHSNNSYSHPTYIPSFYPQLPPAKKDLSGRTVLDISPEQEIMMVQELSEQQQLNHQRGRNHHHQQGTVDAAFGLRSALVQLGQSYWGSGWDATTTTRVLDHKDTQNIRVPLGLTEQQQKNAGANSNAGCIVPLGRASCSRSSKILEGSMDAATMQ